MHYHTIVIGAGPAGLYAAKEIGQKKKKVLVLEKNNQAGKKLLISGSGQCNFTHHGPIEDFLNHYGDNSKFLKKAFETLNNEDVRRYFDDQGVPSEVRENQKVFPKSARSEDILRALLNSCHKNSVEVYYNKAVASITVYDHVFTVETDKGDRYFSDHIVVATGGKSFPHLGCTGDGYELAVSLGHRVIDPKPGLTYVTTHEKDFAVLSGIAFKEAQLMLWRNNKKVLERTGSILFTHKGLSGPVILDSSRWMLPGDELTVNYMYPNTYETLRTQFAEEIPSKGRELLSSYLKSFELPKSFIDVIGEVGHIDINQSCARVSKEDREVCLKYLTKCPFHLSGIGGMHSAMVTVGGIALKEINPTTMESRKQKGLYFVGEVLDIDGDTGGYNIQAAFSTGALCAKHINR